MIDGRFLLSAVLAILTLVGCYADNPMLMEMETFLSKMPKDLQARQAKAIYEAINGDSQALDEIRLGRTPSIVLPDDVDTLRVREDILLFSPSGSRHGEKTPMLIYLHGGGWTFGSINSCSRFCSAVASNGIIVAAVNYPLAPEHSAVQIVDYVDETVRFISDKAESWGARSGSVSLGGDSSGGNLALVSTLRNPGLLKSLVLFYPVTDVRAEARCNSEYAEGYGNDEVVMKAFCASYLGDNPDMQTLPWVSPVFADERQLASLPPILLVAAQCDILCSQGKVFAQRVASVGGDIRRVELSGTTHLFITVPGQPTAFNRSVDLTVDFIRNN
ncbi:MAG: alpha/beta hydrolase [Paramuribaculum sp.]|nr:alpha/beta hydrolase [Paramuribaculum sp.]